MNKRREAIENRMQRVGKEEVRTSSNGGLKWFFASDDGNISANEALQGQFNCREASIGGS
jgi:hypothetical protein